MRTESRTRFNIFETGLQGCQLIEASAGTGKTWSITGLYLRLVVESELLPENILVVTFTKAATAELNDRIRRRLRSAMDWVSGNRGGDDDSFFNDLFSSWEGRYTNQQIEGRLKLALARFDKAAIFTIHSFCQRVLNDYAFEAKARFNLTPLTDDASLREQVAFDFWRLQMAELAPDQDDWILWLQDKRVSPESLLGDVRSVMGNPFQQVLPAAEPEGDPLAIRAEIAALEDQKRTSMELLATLQDKLKAMWQAKNTVALEVLKKFIAAGDMRVSHTPERMEDYKTRLEGWLEGDLRFRLKALAKADCALGQTEIDAGMKKGRDAPEHELFELVAQVAAAHKAYLEPCKAIEMLNESLETFFQYWLQGMRLDFLRYFDREFPILKANQGLLGFDDMLTLVFGALDGEAGTSMATAVASQYKAALIDEFQDTDPLQAGIFRRLFVETKTPMFYVGDPKQAIYSFRGADIFAYYGAVKDADDQLTLQTNWRSTPSLVDSINALFCPEHTPFITDEIVFDWVKANQKDTLVTPKIAAGMSEGALHFLLADNDDDSPLGVQDAEDWASEQTAEKIASLLRAASNGEAYLENAERKHNLQPGNIAVLVPRNKDAEKITQSLAKRGIASVRQGQEKVLKSEAALSMLRLIRAVAEPGSESMVLELLGDPLVGTSGEQLYALKESGAAWESLLNQFWALRQQWLDQGFSAMFRDWLNGQDGNGLTLADRVLEYAAGERHLTDLMHLAEVMQQHNRQQGGINALVKWMQHAVDGDSGDDEHKLRLESDTDRVNILTIHACKGLEYDIVFCPFLWLGGRAPSGGIVAAHYDGQAVADFGSEFFEHNQLLAKKESLMEQLRLLYVALTRGVHRCYVFWANVGSGQYARTANSALAWLLYGDDSMLDDPFDTLRCKVGALTQDEIHQGVRKFCQQAKGRHPAAEDQSQASATWQLVERDVDNSYLAMPAIDADSLQVAALPTRHLASSWYQSSFSGLVKNQNVSLTERADDRYVVHSSSNESDEGSGEIDPSIPSIFNFPRGAMPGECMHNIFENWDFASDDKESLKELVAEQMMRLSVGEGDERERWYGSMADAVLQTLRAPLNSRGFQLATVPIVERQAEMEFLLQTAGSIKSIQDVLVNPDYALPERFVEAAGQLDDKQIKGFLIGFIDLVVKDDEGRYYVLDWKSNHLGWTVDDYQPGSMEYAMAHHHYYLQALIYLVALHRHLSQQLPDYDPSSQLGGAWYIFVRGISAGADTGIYHFQPSLELVLALDAAIGGRL